MAVRLRLFAALETAASGRNALDLPDSVAATLQRFVVDVDGRTHLALPPEETQEALADIRTLVKAHESAGSILVTKSERLRLFVRRLVEIEFPELMVVSAAELERMRGSVDTPAEVERVTVAAHAG
jgi:type III secretory pathway component EscV